MTKESIDADVANAWARQRVWSQTANRLKKGIVRAQTTSLALGILAAVTGVASLQLSGTNAAAGRVLGAVAGAAAGLVPLVRRGADTDHIADWTRARSASEDLKSEVFRHLVGSSIDRSDERGRRLAQRTGEIMSATADLLRHAVGVVADDKPLPSVHDIESYLEHRVRAHINDYYRPTAARYHRQMVRFRQAGALLGATGVVFGVLAGAGGLDALSPWVAVVTTVAASLSAHIAASRYDHQIVEFLRTAQQLELLAARWRRHQLSDRDLVDACEAVISGENQAWMAKWTAPE